MPINDCILYIAYIFAFFSCLVAIPRHTTFFGLTSTIHFFSNGYNLDMFCKIIASFLKLYFSAMIIFCGRFFLFTVKRKKINSLFSFNSFETYEKEKKKKNLQRRYCVKLNDYYYE